MITKAEKAKLAKQFGGDAKNTGATEVQIAILTAEIEDLKPHFETNKKDKHSMKGFLAKIEKRKKLINYLKSEDFEKYQQTIKKLGIRK
ncbi:MAG: 30S ribosomal protein S15 [Mycoplasmataceae bacterium]|nr:30S ribosomal protein S15 [Mycoplasmataceae bacterium]